MQAGRRWCLSGTPIQNAVDELYAYFRFLQYQPYARQAAFKAMLKEPLSANAELGSRRLRAALQARGTHPCWLYCTRSCRVDDMQRMQLNNLVYASCNMYVVADCSPLIVQ